MTHDLSVSTVRWDITGKCNLSCLHCYAPSKRTRDLRTTEVLTILNMLNDNGLHELNLSGREPTMRPDLSLIIQWCRSHNITVNMTTNGTIFDLSQFPSVVSGLNILTFSLDGSSDTIHDKIRGEGNYRRTLRNIVKCTQHARRHNPRIHIGVSCTLHRYNHANIDRMVDICKSLTLDFLAINPVSLCGSARSASAPLNLNANELACAWDSVCKAYSATTQTYKLQLGILPMEAKLHNLQHNLNLPVIQNGCTAGRTLYITPDGQAYPCYMIPPMAEAMPKLRKYLRPLDILSEPFSNASKRFASFLKFANSCTQRDDPTCINCTDNQICTPCPLLVRFDRETVLRCALAYKKLASLNIHLDDSSIPTKKNKVTWSMNGNRATVQLLQIDHTSKRIYELNPLAKCIWRSIDGKQTTVCIYRRLTRKFRNLSTQYIHEQTIELLTYLWKESIIEFI